MCVLGLNLKFRWNTTANGFYEGFERLDNLIAGNCNNLCFRKNCIQKGDTKISHTFRHLIY